ncbi:MAG: ATP-grasp domain-containing protein [Chitinophagales bacterium]|nr:ATP-grasp domain-containing protein [Chitinophagales bacterium]MDW8418665.1 ATP-grasp domain-containing protein [Chitinophagales bacterium]
MSKKILILPASVYQVPFIKYAREIGIKVYTLDNVPDNPGHQIADKSVIISSTDINEVLKFAESEKINAILSPCSDVSLLTAAYVGERMNLIAPNIKCTETLTSKLNFREFQLMLNLPHPAFQHVNSLSDNIIISYPFVIKPDKSSGSKGIYIINKESELQDRWDDSVANSLNKKVIIEKEILGHHLTAEGTIRNEKVEHLFLSDRITAPRPFVATWGHIMPSVLSQNTQLLKEIKYQIEKIMGVLNYASGPFDADVVVDNEEKVYIIEITPRPGGNSLTKIILNAYGFDMVKYAVLHSLGMDYSTPLNSSPRLTKLMLFGKTYPSILEYDKGDLIELSKHPNIKHISLDYPPGTELRPFTNGKYRAGEVVIEAESMEEIYKIEKDIIEPKIKFNKK